MAWPVKKKKKTTKGSDQVRDQLVDMYDFVPHGYLTLDAEGVIRKINVVATALIGRTRSTLEGLPLLGFVHPDDRTSYLEFLRRCREHEGDGDVAARIKITPPNGSRDVDLLWRPSSGPGDNRYLIAIIDVTELETARADVMRAKAEIATQLLSAQDEERLRISRELHDTAGQQVTGLRLLAEALAISVTEAARRRIIGRIQTAVDDLDRQIDHLTSELRPAPVDLGLAPAVEQYVSDWSAAFDLVAEAQCTAFRPRLGTDVEMHIYRVMQEALHNIGKHARARHVSVVLETRGAHAVLAVQDDGRGYDVDAVRRPPVRGIGLVSMSERVQIIGGTLEITSAPGRGTTVLLRVPIADRTESR